MSEYDNICWLLKPIHKNSLRVELSEDIQDSLLLSVDGSILGVDKSAVIEHIEDKDVTMVRMGFKTPPKEDLEYDSKEGLYKYLSYFIDLD